MIDWIYLGFNFCWVLGAAAILAVVSYHYWLAQTTPITLRVQFTQPSIWKTIWPSLGLIAVGFAGTSNSWWETSIWCILIVGFFYYTYECWQTST